MNTSRPSDELKTYKSRFERSYPRELREREAEEIARRRKVSGIASSDEKVGVALSGGGIRSATFCLGIFQALASYGLIRKIDYLSTVSGGGYFGGFLGRMFTRPIKSGEGASAGGSNKVEEVERELSDSGSKLLRWLRENGRYITPNGAADQLLALVVYSRNWVGLQIVLFCSGLTAFLGAKSLRVALWTYWPLWSQYEGWLTAHSTILLWWSPYMVLPVASFLLATVPLAWAYWLTQRDRHEVRGSIPLMGTIVVFLAAAVLLRFHSVDPSSSITQIGFSGGVMVLSGLALACWTWANIWAKTGERKQTVGEAQVRYTRDSLTLWLTTSVLVTLVLLAFALIDTVGQTACDSFRKNRWWGTVDMPGWSPFASFTSLAAVIGGARRIAGHFTKKATEGEEPTWRKEVIAGAAAIAVGIGVLLFWCVISHYFPWGTRPGTTGFLATLSQFPVQVAFPIMLILSIAGGQSMKFLNLSSQQQLYSARLCRAYLGASNPAREKPENQRLSEVIDGDDVPFTEYQPHHSGGPLHLINVTVNETVAGQSQIEMRDRRGLSLAVSPCGISGGRSNHALWKKNQDGKVLPVVQPLHADPNEFHMLADRQGIEHVVEMLDLGNWLAISGAAFSTGLGSQTSLSMSLLLGLTNVRLGYWWDSHVNPEDRPARARPDLPGVVAEKFNKIFPVQTHLLDELLARFHGPARRRWYLTDGGHFENTACYELVRRRVPFIICCDDGQDAQYTFADLANLVRKARLDFNAEIRFFTEQDIQNTVEPGLCKFIGTLEQLVGEDGRSQTHATLAGVYYDGAEQRGSVILFIKPSLTGDEPLDVLQYHAACPQFPQESTVDQYFDEAQWESYRRLGVHIGGRLFGAVSSTEKWAPCSMTIPRPKEMIATTTLVDSK